MRDRRPIYAVLSAAAVCVALLLACGLAGVAVRGGAIAPPEVDVALGAVRLIGRVSEIPYCSQLIAPDCLSDNPVLPRRIYTLWLFIRTDPGSWERPDIRRIVSLQLDAHRQARPRRGS